MHPDAGETGGGGFSQEIVTSILDHEADASPIAIETGWTVQKRSSSDHNATVKRPCMQERDRMHGG